MVVEGGAVVIVGSGVIAGGGAVAGIIVEGVVMMGAGGVYVGVGAVVLGIRGNTLLGLCTGVAENGVVL